MANIDADLAADARARNDIDPRFVGSRFTLCDANRMRVLHGLARRLRLAVILLSGCVHTPPSSEPAQTPSPDADVADAATSLAEAAPEPPGPITQHRAPPAPGRSVQADYVAPSRLPPSVTPGKETQLRVPQDRPVIVVHAAAGNIQAIVYLHGVCGDIYATRVWAHAAARFGTLIAMQGDEACDGRPGRFRWFRDTERLNGRIRRALDAVKQARGGQLDVERVTLIGYSQGADRAERIASRFPDRYPRVLLGSPPDAPDASSFSSGQAVAVVAGALEGNEQRQHGVSELERAGVPALFRSLPGAYHGQFGTEGDLIMGEVIGWLFDQAPPHDP